MEAALALLVILAASAALSSQPTACLAVTSPYVRPRAKATLSLPARADADGQTPQQVHTSRLLKCSSSCAPMLFPFFLPWLVVFFCTS
jgi:hypothetical protein